ncbi:MAG TPA: PA2169 family four-helix-bundle protein [Pyrinomonadaceae bacterium]|nr:PA2169 family four-helix-bundle protein [Pyrinomonadaceae bacterium]
MINDYEATIPMTQDATIPGGTSAETNDSVIATLNTLIETCKDGQEGFKDAAEGVENSELKSLFYEYSQQRAEFVGVLQGLVRSLGGDPETSGSVTGAVHRGWINIKSAVTGRDEGAILNECERGEDHAKEAFAEALRLNLPANVADVISQQHQSVLAAHNRVRALRNAENAADDSDRQQAATPGTF